MRQLLCWIGLLVALSVASRTAPACADDAPLDPAQVKAYLRVSEQENAGFIERAILSVNKGLLPRGIFDSTLLWARRKESHKFQHFKSAMILRASQVGVTLQ
jgi:hypothetical protein